jgi:hypothetical protein
MKRIMLGAAVLLVVAAGGVVAFRYQRLLHDDTPPEVYIRSEAAPTLGDIGDPAERARAERGRYIVEISGCDGCHHTPGPQGPSSGMYLAGGGKFVLADGSSVVASNLTSDAATGLGNVADEDVLRVLRSGVARDGRIIPQRAMPWAVYSNWTEEDRRAVLTYLRHLPPVAHRIPAPLADTALTDAGAQQEDYFGRDYGAPAAPN